MKVRNLLPLALRQLETIARRCLGLSPRPYKILLELTNRCNSRCKTCDIWQIEKEDRRDLPLETARSLLSQLGPDLLWIAFSGGEPTLYRETDALVELIRKHCPKVQVVTFTTNGLAPERALSMAEALRRLGTFLFITVSLDGDRETHDLARGVPGNHDRALRTRELLRTKGFKTFFGITLGSHNARFVRERMQGSPEEFKAVTFVHDQGIYRKDNAEKPRELGKLLERALSLYRATSLEEGLEKVYMRLGLEYFRKSHRAGRRTNVIPCSVIQTSLHVDAAGSIKPCMFLPELALAGRDDLRAVLGSRPVRAKQRAISRGDCPSCWMNCYAVHSMASHPLRTGLALAGRWARGLTRREARL